MAQNNGRYHIFVYGTLMRGERNHALMGSAIYLGAVRTKHAVYDLAEFASLSAPGHFTPGLLDTGAYHIIGEVYEVDSALMAALDEFEEEGVEYKRKPVFLEDGTSAYTYIFIGEREFIARPSYIVRDESARTKRWDYAHKIALAA